MTFEEIVKSLPITMTSHIHPDNSASIKCGVCEDARYTTNVSFLSEPERKDIEWWINLHRQHTPLVTPKPITYLPASVIHYIDKLSNDNILVNVKTPSVADPYGLCKLYLTCKACSSTFTIQMDPWLNQQESISFIMAQAEQFNKIHSHGPLDIIKSYPTPFVDPQANTLGAPYDYKFKFKNNISKLSDPVTVTGMDYLTASGIKETVKALEAKMNPPAEIDIMGDLQVMPGGKSFNNISISQDSLKWVARQSNFNVDLQAKVHTNNAVSAYSAVCTVCNERYVTMNSTEFLGSSKDNDTWQSIKEFCNKHCHDGSSSIEEPTGRKFKMDLYD